MIKFLPPKVHVLISKFKVLVFKIQAAAQTKYGTDIKSMYFIKSWLTESILSDVP